MKHTETCSARRADVRDTARDSRPCLEDKFYYRRHRYGHISIDFHVRIRTSGMKTSQEISVNLFCWQLAVIFQRAFFSSGRPRVNHVRNAFDTWLAGIATHRYGRCKKKTYFVKKYFSELKRLPVSIWVYVYCVCAAMTSEKKKWNDVCLVVTLRNRFEKVVFDFFIFVAAAARWCTLPSHLVPVFRRQAAEFCVVCVIFSFRILYWKTLSNPTQFDVLAFFASIIFFFFFFVRQQIFIVCFACLRQAVRLDFRLTPI